MRELRDSQTQLNYFLWSTELAYGSTVTSRDPRLDDREKLAVDALSDVRSAAWFPNTAGRIKYYGKVSSFLDQLKRNTTTLAQVTLVRWYSCFEAYLERRLGNPALGLRDWGSFALSLQHPDLVGHPRYAPKGQTVLRADLIRVVRNQVIHKNGHVPSSKTDDAILGWADARGKEFPTVNGLRRWGVTDIDNEIREAIEYVVGQALNHVKDPEVAERDLKLPFFYALFAFGNLDSLAREIEEALQPSPADPAITIRTQRRVVRRDDLIVGSPATSGAPPSASTADE